MKRCARCDRQYDDDYDGCPYCAKGIPSVEGVVAPSEVAVLDVPPTVPRPRASAPNAPLIALLCALILLIIDGIGYVADIPAISAVAGLAILSWVVGSWFWVYSDMTAIAAY